MERLELMIQITIGRILSLLIAIGYATCVIIGAHGFTADVFKCCIALLFPLALIWFPEQIGGATGYFAENSRLSEPKSCGGALDFHWNLR